MTRKIKKVSNVKVKDIAKITNSEKIIENAKDVLEKKTGTTELVSGSFVEITRVLEMASQNILETADAISRLFAEQKRMMKTDSLATKAILKRITGIEECEKRTNTALADMANWKELNGKSEKLTPRECAQIRSEINQRVSNILDLKYSDGVLTDRSLKEREKYFPMFINKIYSELKESGVLADRVNDTLHSEFNNAVESIRGWKPKQGIQKLKTKADKNRLARLKIELNSGNNPYKNYHYLSRHRQRILKEIRKDDIAKIRRNTNFKY